MSVAIFDYTDCIDYLTAVLADKKGINPNFSLRAWARQIGIANAGQLSLVLHRKRRISPTLSRRLRNSLPLDKEEVEYFDLLVLHANAATLRDQRFYQASMESFHQGRHHQQIQDDAFQAVALWYHFVILELTYLEDFEASPDWIASRLKGNVSSEDIAAAMERLLRLGLLRWTTDGTLVKAQRDLKTTTDIPSHALRSFHTGMIGNALDALANESVAERDVTAHMVATRRDKLEGAKELIRQFRFQLARYLETDEPCDAVFALNVQLFDYVQSPRGHN